ncbi:cation:proton antiporter [Rhodoferax sp. AJA081-3]|uniref:cation:proton antiporter domain-containing protein n=1 Tax=Rhodoferax sp. AJA081-3 TaxID=2752316 RepID=UPI001ADEF0F7|nr:cation:proton antiporter [Rhodoferax sp. AJA081-3]QTN30027.1 cation:proton antiporter [Rhodoferax sp. AJA081-3]
MNSTLLYAFIFLTAGVISVPLAKRFGLGSVLGYLIAGICIAPLISLLGIETHRLQEFAEFGVVMMLFLVGLELEPRKLWALRHRLVGLGGLQLLLTTLAVCLGAILVGLDWKMGVAIGLIATGSSTAIVLQSLGEKGLLKSDGGEASFVVLLFQDISVIPVLALLPLLASQEFSPAIHGATHSPQVASLLAGLPVWMNTLATILAVGFIIVGGNYLSKPLFRFIASARLREVFTGAALLLVIGIALLMVMVGLSPALGTFLAGVVLANSEYRHELESDIEPFKGLLLGLFFMTVGAGIDFSYLFANGSIVAGITLAFVCVKVGVLWCIGTVFRLGGSDRWLFSLGLAQIGEFAFVLLAFATQNAVMPESVAKPLLLAVALSMLLTPILFIVFDRIILVRMVRSQARKADEIDVQGVAIIVGIGRFGQIVNRILRIKGYETVVLDVNAEMIDTMTTIGVKAFYGDGARPDLLDAAGLANARLLVVAIDDRERVLAIVKHAKRLRPDLHVVARAYDRIHVYDLFSAGCDDIVRETFDSAVRAGRYSLEALGTGSDDAESLINAFVDADRKSMRSLAVLHNPDIPPNKNSAYMDKLKEIRSQEAHMS